MDINSQSFFDRIVLKWPRESIISVYVLVNLLILVPFYQLMPILLSYPPGVRQNPQIHRMLFGGSYSIQYWTIILVSIILHVTPLTIAFGSINKWRKILSHEKLTNTDIVSINKIRKKCNNIPYYVVLAEVIFPIIGIFGYAIYVFFMRYYHLYRLINIIKLILLYFSILSTIGIVSFIIAKRICKVILLNTDIDGSYPGFRVPFRNSLAMQMILMFIVGIIITALAGYAKLIEEKGNLLLTINKHNLHEYFNKETTYSVSRLKDILRKITLYDDHSSAFYLGENDDEYTSDGSPLFKDFTIYLKYLSDKYNGKVHVLTGELQGASIKIQTDRGPYWVGIKYLVVSKKMVIFFIISSITLLFFNSAIFFYFSRSISNDISLITDNLNTIAQDETVNLDKKIPVVSNDEIGDLIVAFNNIQTMTKKHVEYVQKSEAIIREQERLASLGQMIGGIAHNLRTPIMSLAGGLEGLMQLITEYDQSIDNSTVTAQDHHEIAKDMHGWIDKLKPYCSYMSDVITTVKEHSVLNSPHSTEKFTIEELVKRIKIFSDEDRKRKKCNMIYRINVDQQTIIEGNITILLQILHNIIENAFDSYSGNGGDVEIVVQQNGEAVEFQVKDYGEGIPEKIKDRLFKEMVTTKGSGGTGLGLYISLARVISSFQGTMDFESEAGKGTTMRVVIPRKHKLTLA